MVVGPCTNDTDASGQWQHQIRHRFGAAESGILARQAHPYHACHGLTTHLIPNNKSYGKVLTYSPAGIAEVMNFKSRFSTAKYGNTVSKMTVIKIHTSVIPAWNTSKTCHMICYLVLNGGGAMHAWYGCACLPICQISAAPNLCRIWCCHWQTHLYNLWHGPHHHSIPNNKSYGKSWRIPCRDCWGMNFKSRFSTAKYGNTVSKWLS